MPRVPNTYDKSELLNEAEPMDYSDSPAVANPVGGYQSQAQHPRAKPHRTNPRGPPRGIFDDV